MTSIVIPTCNEAHIIESALDGLRSLQGDFEVIVADGASTDDTRLKVLQGAPGFPRSLRLSVSERNRGLQLNEASRQATGEAMLFLHADARLADDALEWLDRALAIPAVAGGSFRLRFEGRGWSRLFTWADRTRRAFGVYYGDAGIFVRREVFERLGGFKPVPLMDDYEFARRLERFARREHLKTVCLPADIRVSDRRWRTQGAWRTLWTWFWVQVLFSAGVPPERLARWYRPARTGRADEPADR